MKYLFAVSDRAEAVALPKDFDFLITGVGLTVSSLNLMKRLMEEKYDAVVNIGTAGGVDKEPGAVYQVSRIYNFDQDLTAFHVPFGSTLLCDRSMLGPITVSDDGLVLASSSSYFSSVTDRMREYDVSLCDMEAYGEAYCCKLLNIPFYSFKVVSDVVGENIAIKDYQKRLGSYRNDLVDFVRKRLEL